MADTVTVMTRDGWFHVPKDQLQHANAIKDCLDDCGSASIGSAVAVGSASEPLISSADRVALPLLGYTQEELDAYLTFRSREKKKMALRVADYWGDTQLLDSLLGEDPSLDPEGMYTTTESRLRSLRSAGYPTVTFDILAVRKALQECLSVAPADYRYLRGAKALFCPGALSLYLIDDQGGKDILDDSQPRGCCVSIMSFDLEVGTISTRKGDRVITADLKPEVQEQLQKTYTPAWHRYKYSFDSVFTTVTSLDGRVVAKVQGDVVLMTDEWLLLCLEEGSTVRLRRYLYPKREMELLELDTLTFVDELHIEKGEDRGCRLDREDLYVHSIKRGYEHTIYDLTLMAPELGAD